MQAVEPWRWPQASAGLPDADLVRALEALAQGEHAESVQARNWGGVAVAGALGINLDDPAGKARVKEILADWRRKGVIRIEQRRSRRDGRDKPVIIVAEAAR